MSEEDQRGVRTVGAHIWFVEAPSPYQYRRTKGALTPFPSFYSIEVEELQRSELE
jgi:hypothetical protein